MGVAVHYSTWSGCKTMTVNIQIATRPGPASALREAGLHPRPGRRLSGGMTKAALGMRGSFQGCIGIRNQDQVGWVVFPPGKGERGHQRIRRGDLCPLLHRRTSIHIQGCSPAVAQAWPLQAPRFYLCSSRTASCPQVFPGCPKRIECHFNPNRPRPASPQPP